MIEEFIEMFGPMVYRIAYVKTRKRDEADDIYQNVFLALIRHIKNLESEEHVKHWLIRTTCNECKRIFRKRSWLPLEDVDLTCELDEPDYTLAVVLSLPDKYKEVIHLFYYEDLSCEEIAATLKISNEAVRVRLHRGRELLKTKLERKDDYEPI